MKLRKSKKMQMQKNNSSELRFTFFMRILVKMEDIKISDIYLFSLSNDTEYSKMMIIFARHRGAFWLR